MAEDVDDADQPTIFFAERQRQDLLDARRSLDREQAAKDEAQRALAEWEAEVQGAERRRAELLAETKDLPTAEAEFGQAEAELREQRRQQGELSLRLGGVRQRLSTMEFVAQRRGERRAELQRVLNERSIYQQLVEAFGKKGLQALLIETAIPEIQDEANRLLDIMTDGRMHVTFKTQRAARSGDNQIETLDIIIRDELGERAYEMYSGGEAFRANFAIRIALSKLLARRAGARLQTLVIDEGFGSQDDQGRDRLVDAIRTIQPEFEKILIITHLVDLKDLFDTRIEVTKTAKGSVIEVA
jgi:exonuclease SbcC